MTLSGWLNWFRNKSEVAPGSASASAGVAYAYWSCLSQSQRCKQESDLIWIPGMANPAKPHGCQCERILVMASENGAAEIAAYLRGRGGIAKQSEWDASDENPQVVQRRLRAELEGVIEKERAAVRAEKEDPTTAVDLYREAIAGFVRIASAGDDWTWRRLPPCYNRLSMLLEHHHRPEEAIETIRAFYAIQCPTHPTKSDAQALEKRLNRLLKAG